MNGKLALRSRRVEILAITLAASGMALVGLVSASTHPQQERQDIAASASASAVGSEANLEKLLALPFVELAEDGAVVVDFRGDPDAAAAALVEHEVALEGMDVRVVGLEVPDAAARRAIDQALMADDRPVEHPACPDRPTGSRSTDGTTTPYFDCEPGTGKELRGPPVSGQTPATMRAALAAVMARNLGASAAMDVEVDLRDRLLDVSLPSSMLEPLRALPFADSHALLRALWFTVYSNGAVSAVTFSIDGDCLEFALAIGGDQCSTTSFDS